MGAGSDNWNVTTGDPSDPCATAAPGDEGTVCADGSVYAGTSPAGGAMFVARCDIGMSWDGANCVGMRDAHPWNNGNSNWVDTPLGNCGSPPGCDPDGEANTATLITTDSDSSLAGQQLHVAAQDCADLNVHGRTDWYLPSAPELDVIYEKLVDATPDDDAPDPLISGFNTGGGYYWSSSELSNTEAWRRIGRSIAFVIRYPKICEVWAADFRDRIVHHLIYNAIKDRYYRRFIRDSYACIPGRGTHDGMRRVSHFARSVTRTWSRPAWAMKADIANFFNSIDRRRLLEVIERRVYEDWLRALIRQTVLHDPRPGAVLRSSPALFAAVPRHKSLMHAPAGRGLPIGNLTSQFFANVYLNDLDQFVKHELKVRYYGRYVDDIVLFHESPEVLNGWYENIDGFLGERLGLRLHPNKKWLNRADAGINFVGFIIKPGRTYLRQTSLSRCKQKIRAWEKTGSPIDPESLHVLSASVNSYLGMMRQVDGFRTRQALCRQVESLFLHAGRDCTKVWLS